MLALTSTWLHKGRVLEESDPDVVKHMIPSELVKEKVPIVSKNDSKSDRVK